MPIVAQSIDTSRTVRQSATLLKPGIDEESETKSGANSTARTVQKAASEDDGNYAVAAMLQGGFAVEVLFVTELRSSSGRVASLLIQR